MPSPANDEPFDEKQQRTKGKSQSEKKNVFFILPFMRTDWEKRKS
jgi:hypothetical protein